MTVDAKWSTVFCVMKKFFKNFQKDLAKMSLSVGIGERVKKSFRRTLKTE